VNGNGILLSTSGEFSNIEVTAASGSILSTATGNINIASENAVTLRAAGMVQLLAKGANGINFETDEIPTPILSVSRNGLDLIGLTSVDLQSFGYDTASGYIDIRATGYANLGEINPLINGTFGIGFFSQLSNINISADDSTFRMEDLHHFLAFPSVNGSLLLQADGQDVDGVGIRIESTIVAVFAELDVAFEANNIHFFDYGISEYNYDFGIVLPTNAFFNRPTIQSQKDQTYVAYGHNDKGNAIELLTSVPNSPIFFRTGFINYYSGGSLLVEGEINTYFDTKVETDIVSATSVVIQGDGLNSDYGIYLTTRDLFDGAVHDYSGASIGSNIEFSSKIDSYILTAGQVIDNAQSTIYFLTGPTGTINLVFDEGALFESANGNLIVNTGTFEVFSSGEISFEAAAFSAGVTQNIEINALGISDNSGNIVWGDPTVAEQQKNGPANYNINIDGTTSVNFYTNYLDIANTNSLEIPRYTAFPGCSNGLVYIFSPANALDFICYCANENAGWLKTGATAHVGPLCFAFQDVLSY